MTTTVGNKKGEQPVSRGFNACKKEILQIGASVLTFGAAAALVVQGESSGLSNAAGLLLATGTAVGFRGVKSVLKGVAQKNLG